MGLMDKFKNLFTEEVEEEEVPIKKEVIQVEIPSPKEQKRAKRVMPDDVETLGEIPVEREEIKIEPTVQTREEEYKFPFFDDEDFEEIQERKEVKPEKKKTLYRSKEVAYNPPREEKHVFKPTPIISPVYGILDKNYVKEDIKSRTTKPSSYYNPKDATIDEIRNKAYGALEEDIPKDIYEADRALYEPIDIIEDNYKQSVSKADNAEYLFTEMEREKPVVIDEEPVARHARVSDDSSDELTSLLEQEMSKDVEKDKQPAKISDKELFSLIDSMYERGDK